MDLAFESFWAFKLIKFSGKVLKTLERYSIDKTTTMQSWVRLVKDTVISKTLRQFKLCKNLFVGARNFLMLEEKRFFKIWILQNYSKKYLPNISSIYQPLNYETLKQFLIMFLF